TTRSSGGRRSTSLPIATSVRRTTDAGAPTEASSVRSVTVRGGCRSLSGAGGDTRRPLGNSMSCALRPDRPCGCIPLLSASLPRRVEPAVYPSRGMNEHVLLVEDDPSIREVTTLGLSAAGFRVTACGDGREGLARQRAEPFDLIILDVMLPSLDGF